MPPLSIFSGVPLIWAQTSSSGTATPTWLLWFYLWGEPSYTDARWFGGIITWIKVVGLFSLLGWLGAWVVTALKERKPLRGRVRHPWLDVAALVSLLVGTISAFCWALLTTGQISVKFIWLPIALGLAAAVVLIIWAEVQVYQTIAPGEKRADRALWVGLHFAFALGLVVGGLMFGQRGLSPGEWVAVLVAGGRLGVTYMGFVVLARLAVPIWAEIKGTRARRLYAIGWQSWVESFRKMGAPWVVLVMFVVILAFANWFLQSPRQAELGRLYVQALMLLIWLLLSVMVVILTPISLPQDIRLQTIYTIVSKPVRKIELIWGRMLGYMALVTVLIVIFGVVSLLYYENQIGAAIKEAEARAEQAKLDNKTEFYRQFREQANQLETRRGARLPSYGSLLFYDSRGKERKRGIDVGIELPLRSFIEGATPSRAVWRYGSAVPNPMNPRELLDRRVPIEKLLKKGTIEWYQNEIYEQSDEVALADQASTAAQIKPAELRKQTERKKEAQARIKGLQSELDQVLQRETKLRADQKKSQADALHSPSVPIEMSFTVYRTTKGIVGELVSAQMIVTNPRPSVMPYKDQFEIHEYYTNRRYLPAKVLVGSRGSLTIDVKCSSVNQYLGMAEHDLFLLTSQGEFWDNYLRGLVGIWLQAMVITAIGVCAGTFLSWPVALLTTGFFFLAGNIGFSALQQFALASDLEASKLVGGGPFESLIRMLSHDNLVSDLPATTAVLVAKTFDTIVMPALARLVYLVPNFNALDMSNTVADGFAVTWGALGQQCLLALAYVVPFSIVGYFILRNREVAA